MIANVMRPAKEPGEFNRYLGDEGAWFAEIKDEINRRLK